MIVPIASDITKVEIVSMDFLEGIIEMYKIEEFVNYVLKFVIQDVLLESLFV